MFVDVVRLLPSQMWHALGRVRGLGARVWVGLLAVAALAAALGVVGCGGSPTPASGPSNPFANAGGPYTGTPGSAINFSGAGSSDPKSLALTYAWMFGDGGSATGVSPTHTYATAGTYTVGLTVTNTAGQSASAASAAVVSAAKPVANAGGPYTGITGTAVSFSAVSSSDPGGLTLTYAWTFGDGGTGTGVSPTHVYAAAGSYSVGLTVTNSANQSATATSTATITATKPTASAGGPYIGVAGASVSFSAAASSDPGGLTLTYAWTFGDGGTGTGVSPTHVYAAAGSYNVGLTVTNSAGQASTATSTATISAAKPVANAGGPYTGVAGTGLPFSAAGSSDPGGLTLTYAWIFGDGGTGTGVSPTHVYAAAGSYNVGLTVTNSAGQSATATSTATITAAKPTANAGGPYTGVAGASVSFSASGSSDPGGLALTYAWTFGDGGTGTGVAPTHVYAAAGSYSVGLTVTNSAGQTSAAATSTATITAAKPVASAGGPYAGAASTAIAFSASGSSDPGGLTLTYAWTFGDGGTGTGISPTHTYTASGLYNVGLTVTNSANQSAVAATTATITASAPVANAGGPYSGTAGTAVAFSAAGSIDPGGLTLTYAWTFGDGGTATGVSPTHTYAAAGTYSVGLTVTNSASQSATATTVTTIIAAKPLANAGGPYTAIIGAVLTFSAAGSSDPGGLTLSYAWTFGDGGTGTGVSPTHTYTSAGSYSVGLTVTNSGSQSATAASTATVTAAPPKTPTARAGGPYTGTAATAVSFDGSASTDPQGETLNYAWSFGDGGTATGAKPTHTYASAGTYTVTLTVTNTDSLSNSATATATIAAAAPKAPTAKAGGPYTGTAGTAVSFDGSASTDPQGETLNYAWSFGDGGAATGAKPTHTYASAGTYTVTLTVMNTDSLSNSATATATIAAAAPKAPTAKAGGPYTGTAGTAVSFDGSASTDPQGETLNYAWSFGDGGAATGAKPTHTYASAGTYTVTLTVTNTDSLSNSATATATIAAPAAQPPVAKAGGPYPGTAGTAVSFDGSGSTDPQNEALNYAWSFGDGGTATGAKPTHTYASAGTYTATLTVTNTDSLSNSATASATIAAPAAQPPVAKAGGPYPGTAGTAVSFDGSGSTDPQNEALNYAWTFGDGGTATGAKPTHTYSAAGTFTVTLTVTNTDGLSNSASTTATVASASAQNPVSRPGGPYTGTAGTAVAFTAAASSDPAGETLSYAWNFGDGGSASAATPSHTYASAGTYTVTLTVTNTDGHSNSASTTAAITAAVTLAPIVKIAGPYTGAAYDTVYFNGAGSYDSSNEVAGAQALSLVWNFGDGGTASGPTPTHTYVAAGTFTVTLTATTSTGGTASATTTATITAGSKAAGAPTANPGGPYTGTAGTALTLSGAASTDPSNLTLTYNWDFGDGSASAVKNPVHTYVQGGTFSVVLMVFNGTSTSTASTTATIAGATSAAMVVNTGGPYTTAALQLLRFDGSKTSNPNGRILTYTWDFGDGSTTLGVNPAHTYAAAGTYTVSLSVTDGTTGTSGNGSATTTVTVTAPPVEAITANAGGPYSTVAGQALVFDASLSKDNLGNALTYTWSFGDGSNGSGTQPSHAYASAGSYTATLTATSGAVSASATAAVTITAPITVKLTSPAPNMLTASNAIAVTGTLSAPGLTVAVNGVNATVSGMSFTASGVPLREGVNLITATASDGQGGIGSSAVPVVLDVTAPTVSITSPAKGATLTTSQVSVTGLVNDIVTGTVGSNDVTVTVNGIAAQVSNRSYMVPSLQLAPGSNTIVVVVTDKVGNTNQISETVQVLPVTSQLSLVKVSGDAQTGAAAVVLTQPLVAQLLSAAGTPVAGRPVTFAVTRSDGAVEVMPNSAQTLTVISDANGKASVLFKLGSRSGMGVNQVSATTPGAAGAAVFLASSTSSTPSQIHEVRGGNQRGLLGQHLAEAFHVIVQDAFSNPVAGATVNFTQVGATDGVLDAATAVTDANGKAFVGYSLGQQEGISNYAVEASFTGNTLKPATFAASAYAPGPVNSTSVSGVVLDNTNTPVPNAKVTLANTSLSTVTDTYGRFKIAGAPVGTVTLTVDGSTATTTQTLPFLSFVLIDLPGQDNTLGKPIFLPKIDVDNAQTVGGNDPVTLTMAGVPGVAFTVAPNSVTFPDGSTVGKLSLSQVKSDMVPMEPSNGSAPNLIWTLQPAGTRFSVPVQVTLPNTQGLAPGFVSEIYQYDHDLEQFVSAGTGHVSADGSVVVSDPGFGITKAGWGHGLDPNTPFGCVQSCNSTNPCIKAQFSPSHCLCYQIVQNGAACGALSTHQNSCQLPGKCDQYGRCDGLYYPEGHDCTNIKPNFCDKSAECNGHGVCLSTGKIPDEVQKISPFGGPDSFQATHALATVYGPAADWLRKIGAGNLVAQANVQSSAVNKYTCCEAKQQLNVLIRDIGVQPTLQVTGPKLPVIIGTVPLGFNLPNGDAAGVYVQAGVNFSLVFNLHSDECTNRYCISIMFNPQIILTFGFNLPIGTFAINGNISSGLQFAFGGSCNSLTFAVSTLPIVATGTLTLPNGSTFSVPYTLYPAETLLGGTYNFTQ